MAHSNNSLKLTYNTCEGFHSISQEHIALLTEQEEEDVYLSLKRLESDNIIEENETGGYEPSHGDEEFLS